MEQTMSTNPQKIMIVLFGILCVFFLASCGKSGDATSSIEAYIQALSDKNLAQISNLSCVDWEQNALIEVDSLTAVGSKIENLACEEAGKEGDSTYVSCTGYLALDYNGEIQQIDLSNRVYIARYEDGDWRMCGYK
jgi:hypothetical protein